MRIKAQLRSFCLAALAAATLASAASNAAGIPGCGDVAGDWDGWIKGCAVIIDDVRESAAVRAKALRIRGLAHYRLGAYDDAIADYSAAIGFDAKNVATYVNRAGAYQRKHDFTRAMADYNLAAALDPQEAWIFFDRGKAYQDMRDFGRARQDYDEAIRLRPTVAVFFRRRGELRKSQGDLAGAGADLDTALRLDPQDVLAYLSRGNLNAAQHDYDKAFADFDKALAVKPDLPQLVALIYSARAMAADEMGDLPRALQEYDAVLKIQPDNAIYLQGRAFTAFAAGDFAAAAAGFGSAVQKNPAMFYSVIMRYVARSRMGEHDTPELRRSAEALERNAWPWPLIGLFLGEVTPDEVRATAKMQAVNKDAERRKCEAAFFLAEYDLMHRRRDEAVILMQEAAKTCTWDAFERNAAMAEAKRLAP
ncbi:MAG TPA: tetratricopeptide repeat protein [Pseudolabrys sp.]|nr:tetratricopeptide repeat protein [Pseudolabrys sp.]